MFNPFPNYMLWVKCVIRPTNSIEVPIHELKAHHFTVVVMHAKVVISNFWKLSILVQYFIYKI